MKRILPVVIILAIGVAVFSWWRGSQTVGTVNTTGLPKKEYEEKVNAAKAFYRYSRQEPKPGALEQSAIDSLVAEALASDYAREKKITITEAEIGERYAAVVAGYNRNHRIAGTGETAFLAQLNAMYGIDKTAYLQEVRTDILKEKIQAASGMPYAAWLQKAKQAAAITIRK